MQPTPPPKPIATPPATASCARGPGLHTSLPTAHVTTVPFPARPSKSFEPPAYFISKGDYATPRVPILRSFREQAAHHLFCVFFLPQQNNKNKNKNKNNNNKTTTTKQNKTSLPLSTNFVPCCGRNRPPFTCKGVLINACYTRITYQLRGPGDSQTATKVPCRLDHWYWTVSRDRRPTGSCVSRSLK